MREANAETLNALLNGSMADFAKEYRAAFGGKLPINKDLRDIHRFFLTVALEQGMAASDIAAQ
jgi:hypothetical protein